MTFFVEIILGLFPVIICSRLLAKTLFRWHGWITKMLFSDIGGAALAITIAGLGKGPGGSFAMSSHATAYGCSGLTLLAIDWARKRKSDSLGDDGGTGLL